MFFAEFVSLDGEIIVSEKSRNWITAVDRAYSRAVKVNKYLYFFLRFIK